MSTGKVLLIKDQYVSSLFLTGLMFLLLALATVYLRYGDGYETYGFGEEIGNIAASLASGNGYGNVFGSQSGPTGWCSPLAVSYYATIFKLLGVKSHYSYWMLFLSRTLVLSIAFYLLISIDYSSRINKYKILLFPIFLTYATFVVITRKVDDVFLWIFFSALMILSLSWMSSDGSKPRRNWLFVLALLLPFTNLSFVVGMTMVLLWFLFISTKRSFPVPRQYMIFLILLMLLGTMMWGVRNSVALDRFIPFRSNLWFEVYHANVVDEDGLSKWSNGKLYHPLVNKEARKEYNDLGEMAFLDKYKVIGIDYLKTNPNDFIRKIGNRFYDAYIFTTSQKDTELAEVQKFNSNDLTMLISEDLIEPNDVWLPGNHKVYDWVCMEWNEEDFLASINSLNLIDPKPIISDWRAKQKIVKKKLVHGDSWKNYIRTILVCTIPLLAILLSLAIKELRQNKIFILTFVLYVFSIAPYLLVSFLPRYQFFQTTFLIVFVFLVSTYFLDQIVTRTTTKG